MTGWQAHLKLDYTRAAARTVAKFAHEGPLRVLQSLYPEGEGVCHNVLVHPPSGLVGGDLSVIKADTIRMRTNANGLKPFVMTNLRTLDGLQAMVQFIETKGMLIEGHSG